MEAESINIDGAMTAVLRELLEPAAVLEALKRKELLTPLDVQKLYSLNAQTMRNMRGQGRGPRYVQEFKGAPVYYEHCAVKEYLAKCRKRTND